MSPSMSPPPSPSTLPPSSPSLDAVNSARETASLAKQLTYLYSALRKREGLISLHLVGYAGKAARAISSVGGEKWLVHRDARPVEEVFEKEAAQGKLIYLSPDAEEELSDELELDCVYVVGGIVDRTPHKGVSLGKAGRLKVRRARLPMSRLLPKVARMPSAAGATDGSGSGFDGDGAGAGAPLSSSVSFNSSSGDGSSGVVVGGGESCGGDGNGGGKKGTGGPKQRPKQQEQEQEQEQEQAPKTSNDSEHLGATTILNVDTAVRALAAWQDCGGDWSQALTKVVPKRCLASMRKW
mmetsp:Transcript_66346/g.133648  ORF Transcript_66346/g.133648 Transcript_66346/m.133648 type:complete len:296 (+) Transcript_66346:380-1267(+)